MARAVLNVAESLSDSKNSGHGMTGLRRQFRKQSRFTGWHGPPNPCQSIGLTCGPSESHRDRRSRGTNGGTCWKPHEALSTGLATSLKKDCEVRQRVKVGSHVNSEDHQGHQHVLTRFFLKRCARRCNAAGWFSLRIHRQRVAHLQRQQRKRGAAVGDEVPGVGIQ